MNSAATKQYLPPNTCQSLSGKTSTAVACRPHHGGSLAFTGYDIGLAVVAAVALVAAGLLLRHWVRNA